jgi:hypothetical protein
VKVLDGLIYSEDKKAWMVLALLAMGLGCSEESPEQWADRHRVDVVKNCISSFKDADPGLLRQMTVNDVTPRELCRCVLYKFERQYTESEALLLGSGEFNILHDEAITDCWAEMLD